MKKNIYFIICGKYGKFKKLKNHTFSKKHYVFCSKCENEHEKIRTRTRINWDIKNSRCNWKYKIRSKICLKKT